MITVTFHLPTFRSQLLVALLFGCLSIGCRLSHFVCANKEKNIEHCITWLKKHEIDKKDGAVCPWNLSGTAFQGNIAMNVACTLFSFFLKCLWKSFVNLCAERFNVFSFSLSLAFVKSK